MLQPLLMFAAGAALLSQRDKVARGALLGARGAQHAVTAVHKRIRHVSRRGQQAGTPAALGLPALGDAASNAASGAAPQDAAAAGQQQAAAAGHTKPGRLPGAPISLCATAGSPAPHDPGGAPAPAGGAEGATAGIAAFRARPEQDSDSDAASEVSSPHGRAPRARRAASTRGAPWRGPRRAALAALTQADRHARCPLTLTPPLLRLFTPGRRRQRRVLGRGPRL
jgi:hypothetical protein